MKKNIAPPAYIRACPKTLKKRFSRHSCESRNPDYASFLAPGFHQGDEGDVGHPFVLSYTQQSADYFFTTTHPKRLCGKEDSEP
jgi:hypothetical protein